MIVLENINKTYHNGAPLHVLKGIDLEIEKGELVSIMGASGSGKSTLLNILGILDDYDTGEYFLNGRLIKHLSETQAAAARNNMIGYIFQSFNLINYKNAVENVALPLYYQGVSRRKRNAEALEYLDRLGLRDWANHMPNEMSGGQKQRVAIARALATNPKVLLCDEATSALDPKTTRQILELIGDINKKLGITVVIITHQMSVVKEVCNHVAILDDGEVVEEGLVSTVFSAPKSAAARHLVFPRGADIDVSDPQQQRRIRLIFRSAKTTSIPLVARLATDEGISATVISANTQKLSEEVYGSMLLGVPNAQFEQAMDFLRSIENLQVEEASVDVQ